jgi:putative ATP-dependent endonuclease of the OLD family
MQADSLYVKRFRSVEDVALSDLGQLNVLIGKNNSGKSNILSALNAFFECLGHGHVVMPNSPIGEPTDYFNSATALPIEITVVFRITPEERDRLTAAMVVELPQIKNAVESMDPTSRLLVAVHVVNPSQPFAFVAEVSLVNKLVEGNAYAAEKRIFSMKRDTAVEIRDSQLAVVQTEESVEFAEEILTNFDEDDWRRMRTESRERGRVELPVYYFFRRFRRGLGENQAPLTNALQEAIKAENHADFRNRLQSHISTWQGEISDARDRPVTNPVETLAGVANKVPQYVLELIDSIGSTKVQYLKDRREEIGQDEAQRLLSLKTRRGGDVPLKKIRETVTDLLGVELDAFAGENERSAELDVDNFLVELNGSGVREALRLILDIELEGPSIVLIEEPEIHLHPALETSMMRYLKVVSQKRQVYLTTHSTNFLDTAEMENVYLISKSKSTTARHVDFEQAEEHIPRELGLRMSSFFMYDRLVFVEGQADADVIREWASKLGVNLGQANVGFVLIGGSRNFSYFAAQSTLSFLERRQVTMWFIIDHDERDAEDVKKLENVLRGKAKVKILNKRELENYLLCGRAIAQFVRAKKILGGDKEARAKSARHRFRYRRGSRSLEGVRA